MDHDRAEGSPDEPHFLSVPDVADALRRMLDEFAHETDRGAVLIAGEIVADTLGSVIETLRPEAFGAKRLKELMRYPGLLASLSARADIAFLAGFIDDNAHGAIGKLRKLRNQAAHSQATFSLVDHCDILRDMCEVGPGTAVGVNRMAGELLLRRLCRD